MEHIDRYPQVARHLPLRRHHNLITRNQPLHGIDPMFPAHWRVLRAAFLWAIIVYSIVAALIALGPSNQHSAIEITLRATGILIGSIHRLCVDGERILNELIADWNSINASLDWAS
jgi:hypothetical protein